MFDSQFRRGKCDKRHSLYSVHSSTAQPQSSMQHQPAPCDQTHTCRSNLYYTTTLNTTLTEEAMQNTAGYLRQSRTAGITDCGYCVREEANCIIIASTEHLNNTRKYISILHKTWARSDPTIFSMSRTTLITDCKHVSEWGRDDKID